MINPLYSYLFIGNIVARKKKKNKPQSHGIDVGCGLQDAPFEHVGTQVYNPPR